MTTPAATVAIAAFRSHCEARAALYGAGKLDLHDAVDGLEAISGPAQAVIGVDAVQAIMAEAFRPYREREWADPNGSPASENASKTNIRKSDADPNGSPVWPTVKRDAFLEAYRQSWEANRKMQASVDASMRQQGVPQSMLSDLEYLLRQDDPARLRRFLRGRTPDQLAVLKTHAAKYLAARKASPCP